MQEEINLFKIPLLKQTSAHVNMMVESVEI